MFLPRTTLPPQSNPAALVRQATTNRIANQLQRKPSIQPGPSFSGQPVQRPPQPNSDPAQPYPWITYESLMRSAKPGIEHIMQMAQQGQRQPEQIGVAEGSTPGLGSGGGQPWTPGADIPHESGAGRALRLLAPGVIPYGLGAIPGIYHTINQGRMVHGNRNWREEAQNAPVGGQDGPYYPPTTTSYDPGSDAGPNSSPYSINGLPADIPPDTTGQNNYDDPYSGPVIDPAIRDQVQSGSGGNPGPYYPPTTTTTEPDTYFDYGSGSYRPIATRNAQSFADNPNQGGAYVGDINNVYRDRENNLSFPWMPGARLRSLDPVTGDMSVGSTYSLNQPNARSGSVRDTQAWVEQQARLVYPRGMGG